MYYVPGMHCVTGTYLLTNVGKGRHYCDCFGMNFWFQPKSSIVKWSHSVGIMFDKECLVAIFLAFLLVTVLNIIKNCKECSEYSSSVLLVYHACVPRCSVHLWHMVRRFRIVRFRNILSERERVICTSMHILHILIETRI